MAREDLMREAAAMTRRIELQLENEPAPVVAGFRRDGAASLFFGEDPVVQFNSRNELRRGFRHGRLLKAEKGRLVALTRVRTPEETQLVRHELTDEETAAYLADVHRRLTLLHEAITAGRCTVLRQSPENEPILDHVRAWLDSLPARLVIAWTPHVR